MDVPTKGVAAKNVDIFATEFTVKISFGSYLLVVDLMDAIVDDECVAKIKQGVLNLKMKKLVAGHWPTLEIQGLSKEDLKRRRASAAEVRASAN